jgi:hypothetical protein
VTGGLLRLTSCEKRNKDCFVGSCPTSAELMECFEGLSTGMRKLLVCYSKAKETDLKVKITDFGLDLDVKTKGMEFEVKSADGKKRFGDLRVTKTGLTWSKGKAQTGNKVTWESFIKWIEEQKDA